MLPRLLCEQLCSLNPDEDRLTFSVQWTINEKGEVSLLLKDPVIMMLVMVVVVMIMILTIMMMVVMLVVVQILMMLLIRI